TDLLLAHDAWQPLTLAWSYEAQHLTLTIAGRRAVLPFAQAVALPHGVSYLHAQADAEADQLGFHLGPVAVVVAP
ncbi:MAG: hypothetical protein ACYTF0_05490, partial [Planctomycetota bacterium]